MMNSSPDFQSMIFGPGTSAPSYESLKRRRDVIDALQNQVMSSTPRNTGEGIMSIAKALMARYAGNKLGTQEDAERERLSGEMAHVMGTLPEEGITADALQKIGQMQANPYLPDKYGAVVGALMRRKLVGGDMPAMPGAAPAALPGQAPPPATPGGSSPAAAPSPAPMPPAAPPPPHGDAPAIGAAPTMAAGPAPTGGLPAMPAADQGQAPEATPPAPQGPSLLSQLNPFGAANAAEPAPPGAPAPAQAQSAPPPPPSGPPPLDMSTMPDVKLTEGQSKDVGYWNRMTGVSGDLDRYDDALISGGENAKASIPIFGNALVSEEYQRGRRAANEWTAGVLRKDTGAAITAEEQAIYDRIYTPRYGDSEQTLSDKSAARRRAEEGIRAGMGTAAVIANEISRQRDAAAPPPPAAAPAQISDDDLFKKYGIN